MKTIEIVTRIVVEFNKSNFAINYLNTSANVVDVCTADSDIDWSKTSTWTVPAINKFCLDKLAKTIIKNYEDAVKITKIELFDSATHELLSEVYA
jgi:hypothetical protein